MQSDMVGLLLGQVKYSQPGGGLYLVDAVLDTLRGSSGQHKPHVVLVFAAVVVGHGGNVVEQPCYLVKALFGYLHGGQGKGSAELLNVVHGAEAGQGSFI